MGRNTITLATRRDILDDLLEAGESVSGRLDDVEFLSRLFDLRSLPSTDSRHRCAYDDIVRHTVANDDWEACWMLSYSPLGLSQAPDERYLSLLVESLHPDVRKTVGEAERLRRLYNRRLAVDGWEIVASGELSGRKTYAARRRNPSTTETPHRFPMDGEELLASILALHMERGDTREIGLILAAQASFESAGYDNWNGGTTLWRLNLALDIRTYAGFPASDRDGAAERIQKVGAEFFTQFQQDRFSEVAIVPRSAPADGSRQAALDYLTGAGITNQGRVRSTAIASRECDGLLFRSEPEIFLYRALKRIGVTFAPLPVFLRGGETYARLEPDFIIIKDGIVMVVEVDGDSFHHESPADAHKRLLPLDREGAKIERVKASECATQDAANACALRLVDVLAQRLRQRS